MAASRAIVVCSNTYCVDGEKRVALLYVFVYIYDTAAAKTKMTQQQRQNQ